MIESDAVVAPRKSTATQVPADKRIAFAASRTMSHYESILSQLYEILGPYTPDGRAFPKTRNSYPI